MQMINLSRRGVLQGMGALVLGLTLPGGSASAATPESGPQAFNAFLTIDPGGEITVFIPSSEMGQGVTTSLPQLVADELDADWSHVRVEHGPEDEAFHVPIGPGYTMMVTGGSNSVMAWFVPMRKVGAAARAMLVAAAAERWGVDPAACSAKDSVVTHSAGHSATYGELAAEAARRKPPKDPPLKAPEQRTLIGTSVPRTDLLAKVNGTAEFGVDVRRPGMLHACPLACPVFGGTVGSVDDTAARAIPGVREVLVFDDFVAVVAETWWPARRGVQALEVTWNEGENADFSSADISRMLREGLDPAVKAATGRKNGKATRLIEEDPGALDAVYEVPYLDHAPMEPLNCTVNVGRTRCDIWTGTQVQTMARDETAKILGLKPERVFIHTTFLGGGFGRRGNNDWVEQAVRIAAELDDPVQVLWTREECIRHGFYRPAYAARMRASVSGGRPAAVHARVSGDNIIHRYLPRILHGMKLVRHFPMEGFLETSPYTFDNMLVDWVMTDLPVPIGFWRSVGHSHNAFFMESFLDEIAHALGKDPVELRRSVISEHHPRFRAVLDRAAAEAGWGSAPEGRGQGVALHECFGSICAQVAEVSMEDGVPKIHKVTAAVDCGPVVNPEIVKTQIMSGLLFGLSSALGARLDLDRGRVVQSNFHDYPLLRMDQSPPDVDVHIVETPGAPVGGIGEIGTPPIAPAVCNAIFACSGKRVRSLPILPALETA